MASASGYIRSAVFFTSMMSMRPMAVTVSAMAMSGISESSDPSAPYTPLPATL